MCHDSFEISLGPRVNFIIGPNGSGKSALLTALVVALGGRATTTQRAKKVSDFIKTGKRSAEITVIIHNYDKVQNKDCGFKPDDYGKEIIVTKVITRDDTSRLTLRSDKNKKISERKAELDEMIEHFGILINNPICILNQEVSKTFLHSKKPEDKFDLFMKATNLEQIADDYSEAGRSHLEWHECNTSKTLSFQLLNSEYERCKEKASFLENRVKLNDMREQFNRELIWALTRDNEENVCSLQTKVREIVKKLTDQEDIIQKREKKIREEEQHIAISQLKIDDIMVEVERAKGDLQDIQRKEASINEQRVDTSLSVERCKKNIARQEENKTSLEESIAEFKQQMDEQNKLDHDIERNKMELERLEREIPAEIAKEKTTREHSIQLDRSMMALRQEIQEYNFKLNSLKTKISSNNAHLRRLKNGQENVIRRYGDNVMRVRQKIEDFKSRFKVKPLGPLGFYLRLKDPEVAPALEIILGKNAHAFICDNHQDMGVLKTILKDVYPKNGMARPPQVICRPFGHRHDTGRFRAHHHRYKTILDCLDIDNNAVHNAIVDRCFIESILYIPDALDAENLLLNQSSIPPNTRLAFTKDCFAVHPNTGDNNFKMFANDPSRCMLFRNSNLTQIKELEKEIDNINIQVREIEELANQVKNSYDIQKREKESNDREIKRILDSIRAKEEQLLTLKTTVVKAPQELSSLEEELETVIALIAKEKLRLTTELEKLKQIDEELNHAVIKRKLRQENVKKHEVEKNSVCKIMEAIKTNITKFKGEIKEAQTRIEGIKKEKSENVQALEEALEKDARSKQNIPQDFERPTTIRPTDDVREDLRKVEAQLRVEIEEMQDPEETKRNLLKRMKEIENLTELKDMNIKNHDQMKKLLDKRKEGVSNLRQSTVSSVATTFATVMRTMKMNGELQIQLEDLKEGDEILKKAGTLEIRVDTNYTQTQRCNVTQVMNETNNNNRRASRSQPPLKRQCRESDINGKENELRMTDTRSLSGGERSFSTVAFVLALWHHCASPFKLMDEIDVFMDMVTRRVSYNALIRYAQISHDPGQFIFFSPLELPKFDDNGSYVRVYEMPAIVRKRPATTQEV